MDRKRAKVDFDAVSVKASTLQIAYANPWFRKLPVQSVSAFFPSFFLLSLLFVLNTRISCCTRVLWAFGLKNFERENQLLFWVHKHTRVVDKYTTNVQTCVHHEDGVYNKKYFTTETLVVARLNIFAVSHRWRRSIKKHQFRVYDVFQSLLSYVCVVKCLLWSIRWYIRANWEQKKTRRFLSRVWCWRGDGVHAKYLLSTNWFQTIGCSNR